MTAAGLQAILQQQSHRMPPEMVTLVCTGYKCDMSKSASESEVSGNLCLHQSALVHQSACFRPVQGQTAGMAFMCLCTPAALCAATGCQQIHCEH